MFARTKRLTLRPGWPEDAKALAQAIGHEEVIRNLARAPWPYDVGDAEAYLALPRGAEEPVFLILAHDGAAPRLIGTIGIHRDGDVAELGYWLTPSAWGHGYATEAGVAVVAMARHALPIDRLVARYALDNPASGRVLRKLGFSDTGRCEWRPSLARPEGMETQRLELDLRAATAPMPIAA